MKAVGALAPNFGVPTLFKSCVCHHHWNSIAMAYHSVNSH